MHNDNINLAIIGMIGWKYDNHFKDLDSSVLQRIKMLGYVSEVEKSIILSNSLIFIYPSFYEGFGIPILEAMINRVPVITSNISSMPEVIGDTGILIEPTKEESMTDAMIKLTNNSELRKDLISRAEKRSKLFSGENACKQYIDLYNRIINE
jgi:glycosyltransferase involved in cell wall biosynthesis